MKTTGLDGVPAAFRLPLMLIPEFMPSNFTITPGSIVSVAPVATPTVPPTTYGLPATSHVVLVEYVTLPICVAAEAWPDHENATPT